jgi:hypothetical protein
MFEIESNLPIPKRAGRGGRRGSKYPFGSMAIGESFFAPVKPSALRSAVAVYVKANPGTKFAVRTEEGGARAWRKE